MIRHFSFSDLDRILEIEQQAFPKSPYDIATFINLSWLYPKTFLVYVERPHGWEKGQILGYIIFSEEGHIISIAVDPKWRRRGIGKKLFQRVLNGPCVKKQWAEVRKSNKGSQAFFLSMGFEVVGVVPNYYGNEDALIVEKGAEKSV